MSEEQWKVVHKALCEPTAIPELGHLCSNIVRAVTQTTSQHLLPALSKMLGAPVSTLVQSELTKLSQHSQWCQAAQYQTALCELFGITEDSICKSLHGCIQQSQRDVVQLVLLRVNSVVSLALKQHVLRGATPASRFTITDSTIQAANELVCSVSAKATDGTATRASPTQPITSADLVSVTRAILSAVTDHMGSCLDEGELKKVGGVITAVVERVNLLAAKDASLDSCPCDNLTKLTQGGFIDRAKSPSSLQSPTLQKLSTENFHAKATKAVSGVLMRNFNFPACQEATSQQNLHSDSKHNHLSTPCHSIDQTASAVLETFIEEMRSIAEYAHCLTSADARANENKSPQDTGNNDATSPCSDAGKTIAAAHLMFNKVQMKLMELYSQPSESKGCITHTGTENTLAQPQACQLRIDVVTRDVVNEIVSALFDEELDRGGSTSIENSSSQTSLVAREFVDSIIAQLQNIICATPEVTADSTLCSEQELPVKSLQVSSFSSKSSELSVASFEVLTSEKFFTEATRAVSDMLLKTVQRSTSCTRQTVDPSVLPQNSLPINPQNVDLAAFDMIQNFVSEIKLCAASIETLATELRMDEDLLTSKSPFSDSGQLEKVTQEHFQRKILTSVKSIYNSMHDKVQHFIAQYESLLNEPSVSDLQEQDQEQGEGTNELITMDYERIETSTKELIRHISNLVKTALASEDHLTLPACIRPCGTSLEPSTFVDDVMYRLKNLSTSADDDSPQGMSPANLHDSVSFVEKLSDPEFLAKASHEVSEALLKSIISQLQPVNSEVHGQATGDSDNSDVPTFFPSIIHSQSVAYDLVGEVIEDTVEHLVATGFFSLTESTASDIVGSVTKAMKDLLKVKLSSKNFELTDGDNAKVSQATGASLIVDRISLTAHKIFTNIKNKVTDCLHKYQSFVHKGKREPSARKAISQILATIQNELPDTEGAENSEQIKLIDDLLSTMIDEIEDVDSQPDVSRPPRMSTDTGSLLSGRRRIRRFLSETSIKEYSSGLSHQICQILKNSYDPFVLFMPAGKSMSDTFLPVVPCKDEENYETPFDLVYSCVEESVRRLVLSCFFPFTSSKNQEIILQHAFESVSMDSAPNSPVLQLAPFNVKTSKSSSKVFRSTITVLTQVLAKEVMERLSVDVNKMAPVESDSYGTETFKGLPEMESQQLLKEKEMKETVLPCSQTSSKTSLTVVVEAVYTTEEDKVTCSSEAPRVSASSSSSLPGINGKDVQTRHEEEQSVVESMEVIMSPPSCESPEPEEDSTSDYACLTSMLIIRLLNRTSGSHSAKGTQNTGVRDEVVDMARVLIEKIQPELFMALGLTEGQTCPKDLKIYRIYHNVYQNLILEYGSVRALKSAARSGDMSFDISLMKLLIKELQSDPLTPLTGTSPEVQAGRQTTTKRFQLPLKVPKIPYSSEVLNIPCLFLVMQPCTLLTMRYCVL
ncbi:hypothetical protein ACEWY4_002219 [Coilia grayii]|uniref:Fibrous sheath-interacting protein 2 n=1 Tax=Coilia grayii TaxID=363190 RepID=A0ABD1KVR6_9TELE